MRPSRTCRGGGWISVFFFSDKILNAFAISLYLWLNRILYLVISLLNIECVAVLALSYWVATIVSNCSFTFRFLLAIWIKNILWLIDADIMVCYKWAIYSFSLWKLCRWTDSRRFVSMTRCARIKYRSRSAVPSRRVDDDTFFVVRAFYSLTSPLENACLIAPRGEYKRISIRSVTKFQYWFNCITAWCLSSNWKT